MPSGFCSPLDIWHNRNFLPTNSFFSSTTYGKKKFVAVGMEGDNGLFLTSPNGKKWTKQNSGTNDMFLKIAYGNNKFVTVGYNVKTNVGVIFISNNGKNWIPQKSGTNNRLFAVTYGNHEFVVVGEKGMILTSINGENWIKQKSGMIPPKIPLPKSSSQPLMIF